MEALTFLGIVTLLTLSGAAVSRCVRAGRRIDVLDVCMGLPIGACGAALLCMLWTIVGVPLTGWSLLVPHLALICLLFPLRRHEHNIVVVPVHHRLPWPILALSGVIVATTLGSSFVHAVVLPTFPYDSLTNWTMRSQISWADRAIAFDRTEDRGMAKPNYPILFHALQITANAGATSWSDRRANAIHWLLSLSNIVAAFLLLRRRMGAARAFVSIAALFSIPLVALHLWQGYADITLTLTCLLALLWMEDGRHRNDETSWTMSAILVAAATWTKAEGLPFCLMPWLLLSVFPLPRTRHDMTRVARRVSVGAVLGLSWIVVALSRGFSLTPHATDTQGEVHLEAFKEILPALFSRGSFGIAWYVLPVATLLALWSRKSRSLKRSWYGLAWGWLVFVGMIGVYTLTPNAVFLLNGESFYRQMLLPLALIVAGLALEYGSAHAECHHVSQNSDTTPEEV